MVIKALGKEMPENKRLGHKRIALNGMLIALALVLSYAESLVPAFFAVPGVKLGLTNIVVLFALYDMDKADAFFINLVRIFAAGFLFGNGISIAYSLMGGLLSYTVMLLLKSCKRFSMTTVSIAGGIAHNIGQIIVAIVLLQTAAIAWYLVVLWFSGIAAGFVVGIICGQIKKRISVL